MSVFTTKNQLSITIGKSISRTSSVQYIDPEGANYLADGEVLIIDQNGTILTDSATVGANPKIRVIQRSGSRIVYSPVINGRTVVTYKGIDGSAGSEQVSTIGYNGTSGSIDVSGTEDFLLNLLFTFDESMWSTQGQYFPYIVENVSGIDQIDVANSLAKQINYQSTNGNMRPITGQGPLIKATILSSEAGAAIGAGTDTVIGFAGSKTVTINDVSGTSVTGLFVAGDYFRAGTTTSSPVYKVVSSTVTSAGGVITLDMPLQASVNLVGNTSEIITAAQAAAADAGVVLTGQSTQWVLDYYKYLQVTFRPLLKNFGATTLATTAAVRPVGSGKQVAEIESFANGFDGILNRTIVPLPGGKSDADTSVNYDTISLAWFDVSDTTPVDGTKPSRHEHQIFMVDGASQTSTATNGVLTVLNAYMATSPASFPAVSL